VTLPESANTMLKLKMCRNHRSNNLKLKEKKLMQKLQLLYQL